MIEAYPLHWPDGFQRAKYRSRSKFKVASFSVTRDRLIREIKLLGGTEIILSTNIPLRNDGLPYARGANPADPGVAVYFKMKGQPRSLACDTWKLVEDNLHALELTVAAMRGLDRWGCSDMLDRVFRGFTALPAPTQAKPWWEVLQCKQTDHIDDIEENFRHLAKRMHPDLGGSVSKMTELNHAIAEARAERS